MELCNATESGVLKLGAYNFDIEVIGDDFYFTHKMINGGFVCGHMDGCYKTDVLEVWNSKDYLKYTKLIVLADNKKEGTLSFLKDGFYLQVPFTVSTLSLDLEDKEDEHFERYEYDARS